MIKVEKVLVMNMENALRGMRNAKQSWEKSDTVKCGVNVNCLDCPLGVNEDGECTCEQYDMFDGFPVVVGHNDLVLAKKLANAGSDHRKFMRQIFVSLDITAPLYWWKEFDTYKVGTVANSESTMHTIHKQEIAPYMFSMDRVHPSDLVYINLLEELRQEFLKTGNKEIWMDLIQRIPTSFNQMRTVTLNYEILRNMYGSRKNHKLLEWKVFCKEIQTLPYAEGLIT